MQSNYYVTKVSSEEDLAQAISIWERNLTVPVGAGMQKYHWFYEANPYRKGKLLLLKHRGTEKAVGVDGVGYRRFSVRGKSLIGAIGADLAIEQDHRALGPALKLQKTIVESAKMEADFLYSFPNKRAEVVLKHLGYHKIADFTRLVKVLRSGDYLRSLIKPGFLVKAISIPVNIFLRLPSMKRPPAFGHGFYFDDSENSSSLFDDLWERTPRQSLLMGERTSKFLNWRYFNCPNIDYKIFGLKGDDETLLGFVIYYLHEKQFQIVDLICPDYKNWNILHALIIFFEKHCLSSPADSISINLIGSGKITEHLVSMGYRIREPIRSVWVYSEDKDLLAKFKDIENSFWLLGDEDNN